MTIKKGFTIAEIIISLTVLLISFIFISYTIKVWIKYPQCIMAHDVITCSVIAKQGANYDN